MALVLRISKTELYDIELEEYALENLSYEVEEMALAKKGVVQ